ncbi:MAG: hypothetical protein ABWZ40_11285 [Caulobacterales bacterium]
MVLSKATFAAFTLGAAGLAAAAGLATRDPHPVVDVAEMPQFIAPAPVEAMASAQALEGVEYNAKGEIIAARIDGLEPPASAGAPAKSDVPVS